MDYISIIRCFNIGTAVIGIFLWVYYYIKYRQPIAFAPITWLLSLLGFVAFRIAIGPQPNICYIGTLNLWGALLQAHAAILLLTASYIMITTKNKHKSKRA